MCLRSRIAGPDQATERRVRPEPHGGGQPSLERKGREVMGVRFLALHPGRAGRISIVALQWTVGPVLLVQALALAFSARAMAEFASSGLAPALRPLLAWSEVAAALLFLCSRTMVLGAFTLLGVLLAT